MAAALVILAQCLTAQQRGVQWANIDPLCGQMKSLEPDRFPLSRAVVRLYRAKAKHVPCCDSAGFISVVHLSKEGDFDLRKQKPGQYWLVLKWNSTEVPVALWFDGKHDFACDERYNNIIEVRPTTGTAELTVITSNDSMTHAEKN